MSIPFYSNISLYNSGIYNNDKPLLTQEGLFLQKEEEDTTYKCVVSPTEIRLSNNKNKNTQSIYIDGSLICNHINGTSFPDSEKFDSLLIEGVNKLEFLDAPYKEKKELIEILKDIDVRLTNLDFDSGTLISLINGCSGTWIKNGKYFILELSCNSVYFVNQTFTSYTSLSGAARYYCKLFDLTNFAYNIHSSSHNFQLVYPDSAADFGGFISYSPTSTQPNVGKYIYLDVNNNQKAQITGNRAVTNFHIYLMCELKEV